MTFCEISAPAQDRIPGRRGESRAALRPVLLPALLAAGSLPAAIAVSLQPPARGPVAVLLAPWWSSTQALLAAAAGNWESF